MWSAGRKLVLAVLVVSGLVLGLTEVASAQFGAPFTFCLGLNNFGNVFRITAFSVAGVPQFPLHGQERLFDERTVDGNAYVSFIGGVPFVNMGFGHYLATNAVNPLSWFAQINLNTGSGPYNARRGDGTAFTGVIFFQACPAGAEPIEPSGPDIGLAP